MRNLTPTYYIYVDANSHKNNTESYYFQILGRNLESINVKMMRSLTELKQLVKSASKKNNQKQYRNDKFVIVVDGDIDYNRKSESKSARINEIRKMTNNPKINIFLSNRCWENWLIFHFEKFIKFTDNYTLIPIPDYSKTRAWYVKNEHKLMETLQNAIKRSQEIRLQQLKDNNIDTNKIDDLPDFSKLENIEQILEINPISYVDLLILDMINKNKSLKL